MFISEKRLKALLQEAADQAVAKLATTQSPQIRRGRPPKFVDTVLVQIRRASVIPAAFQTLGLDTTNMSETIRELLRLGLQKIESNPLHKPVSSHSRLNFRVDRDLLNRARETGESLSNLVVLGLICQAFRQGKNERDGTTEKQEEILD